MNEIKLIGLSGQLQNGKDTVADLIVKLTGDELYYTPTMTPTGHRINSPWTTTRFAGKLKIMTALIIGCDVVDLEREDFKNKELGEEWRRWFYTHYKFSSSSNPKGKVSQYYPSEEDAANDLPVVDAAIQGTRLESEVLTPRLILQLLGTEGGREVIHPNIWVNSTLNGLKETDHVIVTDTRFPNEVTGIKQRGGIVVRVIRPDKLSSSTHISETSLNNYTDWDYVIINNNTLEDLETKVAAMLRHFNIKINEREFECSSFNKN